MSLNYLGKRFMFSRAVETLWQDEPSAMNREALEAIASYFNSVKNCDLFLSEKQDLRVLEADIENFGEFYHFIGIKMPEHKQDYQQILDSFMTILKHPEEATKGDRGKLALLLLDYKQSLPNQDMGSNGIAA